MSQASVDVPINKIDLPTVNPRFEAEDLDELIASIREVGILQPLIGVVSGPDRVRLVAGLRRYSAAKEIGLMRVPMTVHAQLNERQERAISLIENLHRKAQSVIETGAAFIELSRTPMSQQDIAKMVGVSTTTVSQAILIVTKCIPAVKDAVHAGEITATRAFELARMPPKLQLALVHQKHREVAEETAYPSPPKSRAVHGKGEAETALTEALAAVRRDEHDVALEAAEHAVEILKRRALKAVG